MPFVLLYTILTHSVAFCFTIHHANLFSCLLFYYTPFLLIQLPFVILYTMLTSSVAFCYNIYQSYSCSCLSAVIMFKCIRSVYLDYNILQSTFFWHWYSVSLIYSDTFNTNSIRNCTCWFSITLLYQTCSSAEPTLI